MEVPRWGTWGTSRPHERASRRNLSHVRGCTSAWEAQRLVVVFLGPRRGVAVRGQKWQLLSRTGRAPSGSTPISTSVPACTASKNCDHRRHQAAFVWIFPVLLRSPFPATSAVEQRLTNGPVSSARPAGTCRTVAHAVASSVVDTPGVVGLQRTAATAVLTLVGAVMDALSRGGQPSRARVAACCGVRVRAVGDRADVALGLRIDPSVVALPDRLHAASAIASSVEDRVASVLRRAGWQCGDVDITIHALQESTTRHRRTPTLVGAGSE